MASTDLLMPHLKDLFEAALQDKLILCTTTLTREQSVWEEKFCINHPSITLLNTLLDYTSLAHWISLSLSDDPRGLCFLAGSKTAFVKNPDRPLLAQAQGYFTIDGGLERAAYLRLIGQHNGRIIGLSYNLGAKEPVASNLTGIRLVMVSIAGKFHQFAVSDYVRGRASINPKVFSPLPTPVEAVDAVACPFAGAYHEAGSDLPMYALSFVRANVNALYDNDEDKALRPVGGRLTEPPQFFSEQRGRFDFISFSNEKGLPYRCMLPSLLICK